MVMKMVEAETQTVEEMLLEGAKRIGELAEKEAQEAEKNATISENVVNLSKKHKFQESCCRRNTVDHKLI